MATQLVSKNLHDGPHELASECVVGVIFHKGDAANHRVEIVSINVTRFECANGDLLRGVRETNRGTGDLQVDREVQSSFGVCLN